MEDIDFTKTTDDSIKLLTCSYFNNILHTIQRTESSDKLVTLMSYARGWKDDVMFSCYAEFLDGDDEVLSKRIISKCQQRLLTIE